MFKKFIMRNHYIVYIGLSFIILDFYIRNANRGLGYISRLDLSPNLFTLSWIIFFIAIIIMLFANMKKIIYGLMLLFFQIMLLINYIYLGIFGAFFSFKNIGLAEEAKGYFKVIFNYIDVSLILTIIVSILLGLLAVRFMPKIKEKSDKLLSFVLLGMSIVTYVLAIIFLGNTAPTDSWDTWTNKRNIYNSFSDTRKSLQTSGLYEYVVRDIYLSKVATIFENHEEDINYLNNYFNTSSDTEYEVAVERSSDDLEGIFKDKNIIIVMMESIDSWMANDELMPTLNKLMNEGINFNNHYSPIYGGGATFNSEFMVNTGYMTPLNGETASNKYGNNYFPYSLANLFKEKGYTVNSFHQNVSSFYNRGQMSKTFGYSSYYSSVELGVPFPEAVKDTHFITNDTIKDLLIRNDKFMSFITTYTAHTPYTINDVQCKSSVTDDELKEIKNGINEEDICVKAQVRETDTLFRELIATLKSEGILEDTVIVGYTDHYAFGYSDREKIFNIKGSSDLNLNSKLPFFIWNSGITSYEVTKVNSNIDILPTLAYLFGIDYNEKYYIGKNVFDPLYDGFVFFGDYSWYDGNVYYKNGQVAIGENVDQNYIDSRNKKLKGMLDINKKILDSNYFSTLSND